MSFQLTIAEGKEAGKEFVFDQPQVVIGRTSECDVILYDPGVSRQHARIFAEEDGHSIEDLGSSNGTKINGSLIKKRRLENGDNIALGPVVFSYVGQSIDELVASVSAVEGQSTRILAADSIKPKGPRGKSVAMLPEGASDSQRADLERKSTLSIEAVRPRTSSGNVPVTGQDLPVPRRSADGEPSVPRRAGREGAPPALSAAERARLRRHSGSVGGSFRIFWAQAGKAARVVVASLGIAAIAGAGYGAFSMLKGEDKGPARPEPGMLSEAPIRDSFGLGPGVTWPRPDMKVFSFSFNAPVQAVVLIHFQARDISHDEVVVSVNGAEVGLVPADTINAAEQSHELVVPPSTLRRGDANQVIFDSVHNPPGEDPWRIWNVRVEVALLPELRPDALLREAQASFERGQQSFDRREIGANNRYVAWKEYRTAWLMLEAHPEPKPELYLLAREKMREAQRELDSTCSKLLLEVATYNSQRDFRSARATLEHVRVYFPNNDQPCPFRADQKAMEFGL